MFDCANVEMRELLPELAAGTLDAATRARVDEHVASCTECASELETLRAVRGAYATAPAIDVSRVVAALPKPAVASVIGRGPAPAKRWLDWRIAAALTMITVGGLSIALSRRGHDASRDGSKPPQVAIIDSLADSVRGVVPPAPNPGGAARVDTGGSRPPKPRPTARPKAQLAFGGGVDDLDDALLRALMGALDEIDRAPIAPSAEPDRTPVLPVIREGDR
jgi:anti-sigma factor RsiW